MRKLDSEAKIDLIMEETSYKTVKSSDRKRVRIFSGSIEEWS
jgi:hypothetical protein